MTDWFRSWRGAPTDLKWLSVADAAGVAPGMAVAVAWALMDRASQAEDRGSIAGYSAKSLARFFGCTVENVDAIVCGMREENILSGDRFSNWEKRQPKREDDSSERVKRYRERSRHEAKRDETHCNAPETDTEADRKNLQRSEIADPLSEPATPAADVKARSVDLPVDEKPKPDKRAERRRIDYPPGYERFWADYPTDPNMSKSSGFDQWNKLSRAEKELAIASLAAFKSYCRSHPDYRPVHAERYLKDRRFEGHAESAAKMAKFSGVYVKLGSPAWRAWEAHYRQIGKGPPMTDKAGNGWFFPSEFPPSTDQGAAA